MVPAQFCCTISPMAIETIINTLLTSDPKATASLEKLSTKTLKVVIEHEDYQTCFSIYFTAKGIQLTEFNNIHPTESDATISGPINAFLLLALTKNISRATHLGLNFKGDPQTLEIIQRLFFSLNIDWEELLSHRIGDIAAHAIGNTARRFKQKPTHLFKKISRMMAEYITEEALLIPTRTEIENFLNNVDNFKSNLARLEMRMSQFKSLEKDKLNKFMDRSL